MRRLITASVLLAFGLAGCAADKEFEKEILGHPAPESPNDTGWSRARTQTPPPPPAQTPPPQAYAPPPPAQTPPPQVYAPPPAPASAPPQAYAPPPPPPAYAPPPPPAVAPAPGPAAGGQAYTPKPFTPAPVAPATPEPGQAAQPAQPAAQPAQVVATVPPQPSGAVSGDRALFTFQVGNFAHAEKAKELMASLESRGFGSRMEPGKLNNKPFYRVFAIKEGSRAELEGELLALGVTEPRLAEERPAGSAPAPAAAPSAPPVAAPAATPTPAAAPKSTIRYAPPVVEPAPPLPDGYVPPPKKAGS